MGSSIRSVTTEALSLTLAVLLALGPLAAQAETPAEKKAKVLFKDGQKAYDVGDFDGALKLYSEAYKLAPLPGFLFNIAQCHRQLANFDQASFFYGRFIDNSKPKASNMELATQLLGEMKTKQAEKLAAEEARRVDEARKAEDARKAEAAKAAEEAKRAEELKRVADAPLVSTLTPNPAELPPPPPPPAEEETPAYKKWWFWTLIAVGVTAAAGVTFVAVASQPKPPTARPTDLNPPLGSH